MQYDTPFKDKIDLFPDLDESITALPLILPNNYIVQEDFTVKLDETTPRTSLCIVSKTIDSLDLSIDHNIGVVSIAGIARKGKSYLLSRVLGGTDCFRLGNTLDPETFGIWIGRWGLIKDGTVHLLLDTEGVDHHSADTGQDYSILILTLLLSSVFIYNSAHVPQKSDLERLEFMVKLTSKISVGQSLDDGYSESDSSSEEEEDAKTLGQFLPSFLWLIRDVTLIPDLGGEEVDFNTYLHQKVLKLSTRTKLDIPKQDQVKRALTLLFPVIEGFSLPPPHSDPKIIRKMYKLPEDQLSPQFVEGIYHSLDWIYGNVVEKFSADRKKMDITVWLLLMQSYVNQMNDPSMLVNNMTSALESARINLKIQISEEISSKYRQKMNELLHDQSIIYEDEFLYREHVQLSNELVEFAQRKLTICDEEEYIAFMKDVQLLLFSRDGETLNGIYSEYHRINLDRSIDHCSRIANEMYRDLKETISNDGYSWDDLLEDISQLKINFFEESVGPGASIIHEKLDEWLRRDSTLFENLKGYSTKKKELLEKQNDLLKENMERKKKQEELQKEFEQEHFKAESDKAAMEILFKKQQAEMQQKHEEERKNHEKQMEAMRNSAFKEDREAMRAFMEEQAKQQAIMMEKMMKANATASENMAKAIANMPPPQVIVNPEGGGGCVGTENFVRTKQGKKRVREITKEDMILSPTGFKRVLFLKNYSDPLLCTQVQDCVMTTMHLFYTNEGFGEMKFAYEAGGKEFSSFVRLVVVEGDQFYCNGLVVSSHSHFKLLPRLSPLIDRIPTSWIGFWDYYVSPVIENLF